MDRGDLTNEQWEPLSELGVLPPQKPHTGRTGKDHRQIINGIMWVLRTGAPWRSLPKKYGPSGTVSSRFYQRRKEGVWEDILKALACKADASGALDWEIHQTDRQHRYVLKHEYFDIIRELK